MSEYFDCKICFETKNTNKVKCPYCELVICRECAQKWLLMEKVAYCCPNCEKEWNFSFIYNTFPLNFIDNELKPKYAEICSIIDKQEFLQPFIDKYNFCKNINNVYRILIDNNITFNEYSFETRYNYPYTSINKPNISDKLLQELHNVYQLVKDYINFELFETIFDKRNYHLLYNIYILYNYLNNKKDLLNEKYLFDYQYIIIDTTYNIKNIKEYYKNNIQDLQVLIEDLDNNFTPYKCIDTIIYILTDRIGDQANQNIAKMKKLQQRKICICINCQQGYLYKYNTQLICDTCKSIFCINCREKIYPDKIERIVEDKIELEDNPKYNSYTEEQKQKHICNPETVSSINYITNNTKNCPNCCKPIEKGEGCNDMFCTQCNTIFNWSDLRITKSSTNPNWIQWLRNQGITPERYNHPDAQLFDVCNKQLSYSDCVTLITKYIPEKYISMFLKFAQLLELKIKPNNQGKMDIYRKKYAFGFITEKQYSKYLSTLYISKFFIDNYNAIISNTIFVVSELFKDINLNKLNLNIDNYITSMNEIISIHNEALTNFSKLYPKFNIQIVDNNIKPITMKNKKIVENRFNLTISYDNTIQYLDSPIKLICNSNNNYNDFLSYSRIYIYFLSLHYDIKLSNIPITNKYIYKYFPNYTILNNKTFYKILTNNIILKEVFTKSKRQQHSYSYIYNHFDKYLNTKINCNFSLSTLNHVLDDILHTFINLKHYKTVFNLCYTNYKQILENKKVNYLDLINEQTTNKEFNTLINRAKLLQNNLYKIYKYYDKTSLIDNLQKNNIYTSKFINEDIFIKNNENYCLILTMEKDLMNSIKQFL